LNDEIQVWSEIHGEPRLEKGAHSQMGSNGLFTCHMIYVCPCNAKTAIFGFEAANTTAVFFDRGEVSCIGGMAQVDGASGRDGVSETLCRVMISRTKNNASA
jgi:hypothetical protein